MAAAIVTKAAQVKGKISAARMWEDLYFKLYTGNPPFEQATEYQQAIDVLERDFPFLQDATPGEAEEIARGMGHGTKDRPDGEAIADAVGARPQGRRRGEGRPAGAGARSGSRRASRSAGARRRASGRSRARGRASSRRLEQTGIPGAARSITETTMRLIGLTVGLSLLYLLLSNSQRAGRGKSALEQIGLAVTRATRALIAPVDPISGVGGARPAPGGAKGAGSAAAASVAAGSRRRNGRGQPSANQQQLQATSGYGGPVNPRRK